MIWTVYHAKDPNFGFGPQLKYPDDYQKVAEVECENLEEVFRVTNHIDRSWTENPEVKWHAEQVRSTSVGDIVVDEKNNIFSCENIGWVQINL